MTLRKDFQKAVCLQEVTSILNIKQAVGLKDNPVSEPETLSTKAQKKTIADIPDPLYGLNINTTSDGTVEAEVISWHGFKKLKEGHYPGSFILSYKEAMHCNIYLSPAGKGKYDLQKNLTKKMSRSEFFEPMVYEGDIKHLQSTGSFDNIPPDRAWSAPTAGADNMVSLFKDKAGLENLLEQCIRHFNTKISPRKNTFVVGFDHLRKEVNHLW